MLAAVVLAGCGDSRPSRGHDGDRRTAAVTATPTPIIEKVTGDPTPMPEITPSGKDEPEIVGPPG